MTLKWERVKEYTDIIYERAEGIARVTINRPEVRNAFRPETVMEMIDAFQHIRDGYSSTGVVLLRGQGNQVFSVPAAISACASLRRLRGRRRCPEVKRARSAATHSHPSQARDRRRGGLCHRRRPRAARLLRSHHCRGERRVRPGGTEGRQFRRRLRRLASLAPGGAKKGEGDVVPLSPVQRTGGAADGPRQRGGPARAA